MERNTLAFVGDMHIAPAESGADRAQSNLDRPARRRDNLLKVLEQIAQASPAAVFFGGDNTNQPLVRPGYPEALLSIVKEGNRNFGSTPFKFIPGNHDVGSTAGWHHHDPSAMKRSIDEFRRYFGNDYWVHEAAGFKIIGINSQILGSSLTEAEEQAAWFSAVLKEPSDLIRAVFLHTPPYLKDWNDDFSDGSEQMCLKPRARDQLKGILTENPPEILISAHVHRYWLHKAPRWWWLGIPATALPLSEMAAVPDHNVPRGRDRLGWVSLRRTGKSWEAALREIPS
jgi:hypothetical protein